MIKNYSQYHIADLRIYAKKIGVKSPTTKNKKEMIKSIRDIEEKGVNPEYSNRGRPTKKSPTDIKKISIEDVEKLIEKFKSELIELIKGD